MAIAFDASSSGAVSPGTSLTVAHTCGTASVLFVGINAWLDGTTDAVSGVTYNGITMSRIAVIQQTNTTGNGASHISLYALLSPASGTHDVVVSASGSTYINIGNASYAGSSATAATEASTTASGYRTSASSFTSTVTVASTNAWLVWVASDSLAGGIGDGGDTNFTYGLNGGTQRVHFNNTFLCDNGPMATGSQSLTLTNNANSADWGAVLASVPLTGGGGGGGDGSLAITRWGSVRR